MPVRPLTVVAVPAAIAGVVAALLPARHAAHLDILGAIATNRHARLHDTAMPPLTGGGTAHFAVNARSRRRVAVMTTLARNVVTRLPRARGLLYGANAHHRRGMWAPE